MVFCLCSLRFCDFGQSGLEISPVWHRSSLPGFGLWGLCFDDGDFEINGVLKENKIVLEMCFDPVYF